MAGALKPLFPVVLDIGSHLRGDYVTPDASARMQVLWEQVKGVAGLRYVVGPVQRATPHAYYIPLAPVDSAVTLRVVPPRQGSPFFCELFPISGFRFAAYGPNDGVANSALKPMLNSCECVSVDHLAAELAKWATGVYR